MELFFRNIEDLDIELHETTVRNKERYRKYKFYKIFSVAL